MNTSEIVDQLSEELEITKTDTRRILKAWSNCIVKELEEDNHFVIPDLGSFGTHTREEQTSYNPYYKRYMKLPPKRVADFKPSKKLKRRIQEGNQTNE